MRLVKRLILASQSPRRLALLNQIGIRPEVLPANISEDLDPRLSPVENARVLALSKAEQVAQSLDNAIIIGADTIVVVDGECLAKPKDREDAKRMLRMLSGRSHTVVTGFALVDRPSDYSVAEVVSTVVTFRDLPDEEIYDYVESGSPLDKAGAYGIQDDYGAVFVSKIEGCFYNVVGFPLSRFYTTLERFQSHLTRH
ncbi:MAG: septum formation inhibitor Maf [Ignavibacteriae bacterium]|nr:septum formation inhibitor Maf [Ignavibacteriota bacterium]